MSATIFATTSPALAFAEDFKVTFFLCFLVAVLGTGVVSASWRENDTHGIAITDWVSWPRTRQVCTSRTT